MRELQRQVQRARRRLWWDRFFRGIGWALFVGLLLAVVGMTIPKIWNLSLPPELQSNWTWLWIGGGLAAATVATLAWTSWRRASLLDAALEVDRRFRLKERLSSVISLGPEELESEVGAALLQDAVRRAEAIEVRDQFALRPRWTMALPLLPVIALIALTWIPDAAARAPAEGNATTTLDREEIKVAVEQAKQKLAERLEEKSAEGLKEALEGLQALDRQVDRLQNDSVEEKKVALAKLNDVKKQVAEEQARLGGAKDLQDSLKRLADAGEGPARKIAQAMKEGDLNAAREAVKELARRLQSENLSDAEREKLAGDLKQLAQQLKKMADQQQQQQNQLQQQIQQARQQGDLEKAAELQQKLDELKKNATSDQLEKMAENLKQCAECMNPGSGKPKSGQQAGQPAQPGETPPQPGDPGQAQEQAGQALEDLARQLEGLQQQLEDLEGLEDLQDDLNQLKQSMQGMPNNGPPSDETSWQDWAQGEGRGGGKRGSEEGETGNYKSKVEGQVQKGQTVVTGTADGANLRGRSAAEIREAVQTSMNLDSDPLENQRLPRSQREHAQQYFEKLRKGN